MGQNYSHPFMTSISEKNAIYDNSAATARRKGHSKRISYCISTPYPGHAMQNLKIELKDIHSRFSLRKFAGPHPLRDRLCFRDIFISRIAKIRKSQLVDRMSSRSFGLLQQCLRDIRTTRTNCIRGGCWLTPWSLLFMEEDDQYSGMRGWPFLTELIEGWFCQWQTRHWDGSYVQVCNLDSPHELDMLHRFPTQAGLFPGVLKACISGEPWITDRKALAGMHPSMRSHR